MRWLITFFLIFVYAILSIDLMFAASSQTTPQSEEILDLNEENQESPKTIGERNHSLDVALGITDFTGNRGKAYENQGPSLLLTYGYFLSPSWSLNAGFGHSDHSMTFNNKVIGFNRPGGTGLITVDLYRFNLGAHYYFNEWDLFSKYLNPHLIAQFEYWIKEDNYIDFPGISSARDNNLGVAAGVGFETPFSNNHISLKTLVHAANYKDTYTQLYRSADGGDGGVDDLQGTAWSVSLGYGYNW